jgi:hypothetical protein
VTHPFGEVQDAFVNDRHPIMLGAILPHRSLVLIRLLPGFRDDR